MCIITDPKLLGLPVDDRQAVSNVSNDHTAFVQKCFTLKMKELYYFETPVIILPVNTAQDTQKA
jgi:hypothetical protein